MRAHRLTAGLVAPLLAAGMVQAQEAGVLSPEQAQRLVDVRVESTQDPTVSSPLASNRSSAVLEISEKDKIVRAQIARQFGTYLGSLTVKGPVDEDAEETTLATLDGLSNSFSARLGLTRVAWKRPQPSRDLAEREGELCRRYAAARGRSFDHAKEDCTDAYFGDDAVARREFERVHWGDVPIYLFSAYLETGRKVFKYVEKDSLADGRVTRNSFAAGVAVGVLTRDEYLLGMGYRYEKAFSAGDAVQICRPLGTTGALECVSRPRGGPEEKRAHVVFAELRKLGRRVAANPRISHDLEKGITGFDLPVYFFKNPDGQFAGGIRLGWISRKNEVSLTAFFGPAPPLGP